MQEEALVSKDEKIDPIGGLSFILMHMGCLLVFWAGFSWIALAALILTYCMRMFAITGVYHRYFSHKSYRTSRWFQFFLGLLGACAVQKGPLWWASHHRYHHRYADTEEDIHSPTQKGLWWSHIGWIICEKYKGTDLKWVQDLAKFPELLLLERLHLVPPLFLATGLYALGSFLDHMWPWLNTSGLQLLVWGFFISTVFLYHGTFTINSLAHVIGRRRFDTPDDSRNSLMLALVTLGEGWHNNHHRFPSSERQGFYWWEIDISHYILKILSLFGLVWDLKLPPKRVYSEGDRRFLAIPSKKISSGTFE